KLTNNVFYDILLFVNSYFEYRQSRIPAWPERPRPHFTPTDLCAGHRPALPVAQPVSAPSLPLLIYLLCFLLLAHSLARANTQSLCLQSLPHSFPQNTRGGGTSAPPWRTKMKLQAANPSALSTRCQFYTPSGRQCRLFASDQNSLL